MNAYRSRSLQSNRQRLLVTVVLAATIGIGTSAASVGSAGASVRPKALANITIAASTNNVNVLPIWVGQSKGFFAQHNLNVTGVVLSAATYVSALLSGSVPFLALNASTFLADRATQHLPIEVVSPWSIGIPVSLIVTNQFATEKGITKNTPVQKIIQDLVGSTGGSSSPVTTGQAYELLRAYGVQPSQVTEVSFASLPAVETAFEKNSINWLVAGAPTPQQIQALGYGTIVASAKNAPTWRAQVLNLVLATTTSYAAANPGISRELVAGLIDSTTYIQAHEQKCVTILQQNQPGVSRPILFQSIQVLHWPTSGKMNTHMWRVTIAFTVKTGQVAPGVTVAEGVDWTNKFVTH